jgi:HK97 family phage major capsid protein
MKPHEMRAQAAELTTQAAGLYAQYRDAADGMPDDVAKRYDGLLDQAEALQRKTAETEAREQRLNAVEAAASAARRDPVGAGGASGVLLPHNDVRNTGGGIHEYSLLKAIRETWYQREGRGQLTGLEAEVHTELDNRRYQLSGRRAKGVMVPWDLPIDLAQAEHYRGRRLPAGFEGGRSEYRALTTTTGVGSLHTVVSPDLIALLRSRMVLANMGATIMPDMQGLFAIPRQSGAATGTWVAEGVAPAGTNQTIDQVAFSPKTCAAFTDYTRRFLEQTTIAPEMFVREDLTAVIARALELAGIQGGQANGPIGVLANAAISAAAVPIATNGGFPTWSTIVGVETAVATNNADVGSLGYVTNAKVRGYCKQTAKIGTTYPIYMWDGGPNPLNGYPVGVTNLVPFNLTKGTGTNLSALLFGNWADLVMVLWSGIDILVDPYTGSSSGTVRVVALQDADVNVRHPESFSVCVDVQTA